MAIGNGAFKKGPKRFGCFSIARSLLCPRRTYEIHGTSSVQEHCPILTTTATTTTRDMESTSHDNRAKVSEGHSGCAATPDDRVVDQCEPIGIVTLAPRVTKAAASCWPYRGALGKHLISLVLCCAVSILVVSIMRPVTPATTTATTATSTPLPMQTPVVAQTVATDQPAPPKWCWCRLLDADGTMAKNCVAAFQGEEYCVCRCPAIEKSKAEPSDLDDYLVRVTFAFAILSLPVIVGVMIKYDFHL
ncbi:hypothetical protein pneo_cds_954 [Pandoravirus neocaledonia]|uniref:Uncharacterized protein n=1 Tax=Pandoravirus neocaledonia TaxID=2107708 RepID=A0A2U7UDM1_9VIRU|nr:hypothetical protein pneo_cds_954 [Pandoravirus neocaledonia]AVK76561.1 hypothetical protein pneo_cds_954 [Pandoravirus neocaledonia]